MQISFNSILSAVIGSGPVAAVLFWWLWSERSERRQLQDVLMSMLKEYAGTGEATLGELKAIKRSLRRIGGIRVESEEE